jgi:hypothetical protein
MCERGTTTEVIIDGKSISIDSCIAKEVKEINENTNGCWKTLGSCCGHGIYPATIIVKGLSGTIFESFSHIPISRKRNFYRRDANGLYYLPEVKKRVSDSDIGGD